jgi:hypothetical protein
MEYAHKLILAGQDRQTVREKRQLTGGKGRNSVEALLPLGHGLAAPQNLLANDSTKQLFNKDFNGLHKLWLAWVGWKRKT